MYGVNYMANSLNPTYPAVSQSETLGESSQAAAEGETQAEGEAPAAAAVPAITTDVSAIVEKAMPSVVAINNKMIYQANSWFGPSQTYEVPSSGSGIVAVSYTHLDVYKRQRLSFFLSLP